MLRYTQNYQLMRKFILPLLLLIIFFACKKEDLQPEIIIIRWEGTVSVSDTFTIEENEKLIIAPGTTVNFAPAAIINANGDISIEGKPDSIIRLIVENPIGNHRIISAKGSCQNFLLGYTEITNGLVTSFQTKNYFHHVTFTNNQPLVWDDAVARFWNGSLVVEDCIVDWNNQGEGFLLHELTAPSIKNCLFKRVPDAVEYIDCTDGEIIGCWFENMNDDAIDQNHCFNTLIKDNVFYKVKDRALELGSEAFGRSDSLYIINNLFVDCTVAINVKEASFAIIENATFYNNKISLDVLNEEGNEILSRAELSKSVFVGGDLHLSESPNSMAFLSQCMSDKTLLEGPANIKVPIEFVDAANFDFTIVASEFPEGMNAESIGYRKPD